MTGPVRIQSKDRGIWFEALPNRLSQAVNEYDLPNRADWAVLDELSTQTLFEGIEVHGEAAIIDDGNLVAPATVYVELQYDPKSEDAVSFHDSYPARVFFQVHSGEGSEKTITIDKIEVDTSSFFEA